MNNCLFEPSQLDRIEAKLDQLLAKKKRKPQQSRVEYCPQFETAWMNYPSRAGNNPKKAAYQAYMKRHSEGATYDELNFAAMAYCEFCDATDKIGTEFTMMASTFYGCNRPFENDWSIPTKSKIPSNDEELQAWASKNGHRQAHPGESYKAYRAYLEAES